MLEFLGFSHHFMGTEDPPKSPKLSEGLGCWVVDPAKAVWSAKKKNTGGESC